MPRKPLAQSRELPIILGAVGTIPRRSPVCAGKRRKVQTFLKKPKSLNFWCAETAPHKTGIWAASKLMFKRSVQNGLLWLHQSVNQRAGARNLFGRAGAAGIIADGAFAVEVIPIVAGFGSLTSPLFFLSI